MSGWGSTSDHAAPLTMEEGVGPDEAGVPHSRAQKGPLQERAVPSAPAPDLQGRRQAQHRQALDQGADPGWPVLRDPEEEVDGTGEEEGAQPPAQARLLWETRGSPSAWSPASSRPLGGAPRGQDSGRGASTAPPPGNLTRCPRGTQPPEGRAPSSGRLLRVPGAQA